MNRLMGSQRSVQAACFMLVLSVLTGCGPEPQTTVGQANSGTVPVSLALSIPQDSTTASTNGSWFWARVLSWVPSPTKAWAVTYDLSELTVSVTDSNNQLLRTQTEILTGSRNSGDSIPITFDVQIGPDRIFAVSGRDRISGQPILQGKSAPTTLTEGQPVTVAITLNPVVPPALVITTPSPLPSGTVNQPYPATTLTATGGTPPLTWDPVVTPPLPSGFNFNTNTATISGTALSASGPTTHTFTVRDTTSPSNQTKTKGLQLAVNSVLTIDTVSPLPTGTVGVAYTMQLSASGSTPPYSWSMVSGDPAPGLTLSASGQISGTPNTAQGSPFIRTYRVTDQAGVTKDAALTITISQQLVITGPPSLPSGVIGTAYSATVTAVGGTPPYSWTVTPPLPTGLDFSFSGATATISGIPQAGTAGTTTHTVSVTDSSSPTPQQSTKNYALTLQSGIVSGAGVLTDARSEHTATLLLNGKVLVVGGLSSNGAPLASVELFDPTINQWVKLKNGLTDPRYGHTATRLQNGNVLVMGGLNSSNVTASVELYDPSMNQWTTLGTGLTLARQLHTATRLPNGKVLVVGGNSTGPPLSSVVLFDSTTNQWSQLETSLADAREFHTATDLPNGNVLVVGGRTGDNTFLTSAELFDPTTNQWNKLTSGLTDARWSHTATRLTNGKVLIVGGINGLHPLASAELLDVP